MLAAIAKILQAGVKYALKKKGKGVAKDYAKKGTKMKSGGQKATGKTKAEMPAKSKPGSIRAAKEKKAKRINEFKNQPKEGSPTYRNMLKKGVEKQTKRTKGVEQSRKPGMSSGYKLRTKLSKEISNTKRQMAKQGHSKELGQKLANLQKQIDKSYKK